MKKKFSVIYILFAFIISIGFLFGHAKSKAFAENSDCIQASSKSAYLMDSSTGTVIYKKDELKRLPIASMCKIMTLLLCFEAQDRGEFSVDEEIPISLNAEGMGGSQVFLDSRTKYIAGDLIKSIVVASANDASVAMAEKIAGNENSFVEKMNEKAKSLGMNDTQFVNCTGLPKPNQYSCAKDVAIMFAELIKHNEYFNYSKIWTDKVMHAEGRTTEIANTNKLIRFYQGCDCGKTGYTTEAGHCLAASASRDGMRLISVVISSPDSKTRFRETTEMFNYGFANYTNKLVVDCDKALDIDVKVLGGKSDVVKVNASASFYLFSKKGEKRSIEVDFVPIEKLRAPILSGEKVGELFLYENGIELARINVIASEDVLRETYFDVIKDLHKNWALL